MERAEPNRIDPTTHARLTPFRHPPHTDHTTDKPHTMGFMGGFGFSQSQAEKDAWEVKAYQDTLASRVADHHNAMGDENFEVSEEKNAGGYKQNYRAFILAFAAYMG
jgi:hypothetical protein